MRFRPLLVLVASAGLLVGCVASGLSSGGTYRKTIGTTTATTVRQKVPEILASRYGYRFDRRSTQSQYIRYLTGWQQHSVLPAEEKKGYTAVRTRVELIAQPRDRASGTYTAEMTLEYMVQQKGGVAGWTAAEIPSARQNRLDDIYEDLSEALTQGIITL
ncbi:MAG: hypothetical protein ABEK84_10630 [Salinibacter sp.]